jgi:hypothetical protein
LPVTESWMTPLSCVLKYAVELRLFGIKSVQAYHVVGPEGDGRGRPAGGH